MALLGNKEFVKDAMSRLGLGGSSLPGDPETAYGIITEALRAGIPYVDMASRYVDHQGIAILSQALRHNPHATFTFGYKYPHWMISSEREFLLHLEELLRMLNLSHLDVLLYWGLSLQQYEQYGGQGGQFEWANRARCKGLIQKIGFTANDSPASICRIVDSAIFESVTLELNLLHTANLSAVVYARSKSVEVNVLGVMGGSRFGRDSGILNRIVPGIIRTPELALRYALGVPEVNRVLLGVSGEHQLAENIALSAKGGLAPDERILVEQFVLESCAAWERFCDSCGACGCCPRDVAVTDMLKLYPLIADYGITYYPGKKYTRLLHDNHGYEQCDLCMKCVDRCKFNTPVPELLSYVHTVLNKQQGVMT
jgi:predicted aldo/keto reductase-like oxidoreductase